MAHEVDNSNNYCSYSAIIALNSSSPICKYLRETLAGVAVPLNMIATAADLVPWYTGITCLTKMSIFFF